MKLYCKYCEKEVEIRITFSGPHLKASCDKCKKYLKFLSKREKRVIEAEEDKHAEVTRIPRTGNRILFTA